MTKIIELIMEKKWLAVAIFLLFTVVVVTVPVWASYQIGEVVREEIKPLKEDIQAMGESVENIESVQFKQIYGSAIAAYDKFDSLEDIQNSSSSQNKNAIELGLSIPKVRELLLLANREKTLIFIEYFNI